ncbi:MAG: hypothetical protein WC997_14460, partial [Porticoccaceae bacterium]
GRILGEIDEKEPLSLMISSFFNRQCGNWVIVQSFLKAYSLQLNFRWPSRACKWPDSPSQPHSLSPYIV